MAAKPQTVDQYIESKAGEAQKKLKEIRQCITAAAPGATESIKWSTPAISYKRILVTYAAFTHHIGFYPTPSVIEAFSKELEKYKTATGSVQFPLDQPLPLDLITKMTKLRVKQSLEDDRKWMEKS